MIARTVSAALFILPKILGSSVPSIGAMSPSCLFIRKRSIFLHSRSVSIRALGRATVFGHVRRFCSSRFIFPALASFRCRAPVALLYLFRSRVFSFACLKERQGGP